MSLRRSARRAAAILAIAGGVAATVAAPAYAEPKTWHNGGYYGSRDGCLVAGYNGMLNKGWSEYQCENSGETAYVLWYLK